MMSMIRYTSIQWLLTVFMTLSYTNGEFMLLSNNGFDSFPLIRVNGDINSDASDASDVSDASYDWYNSVSSSLPSDSSVRPAAGQFDIRVRRVIPPLPRLGRHLLDSSRDDLVTWSPSQSKLRRRRSTVDRPMMTSSPSDDIHPDHYESIAESKATRATPLPRLGFRRSALSVDERSVPLPRIGRYLNTRDTWSLDDDDDVSSSGIAPPLPRLGLEFKQYERSTSLPRIGIRSTKPLPRLGRRRVESLDLMGLAAVPLPRIGRQFSAFSER